MGRNILLRFTKGLSTLVAREPAQTGTGVVVIP